jgi:hypothetical protein
VTVGVIIEEAKASLGGYSKSKKWPDFVGKVRTFPRHRFAPPLRIFAPPLKSHAPPLGKVSMIDQSEI